MSDSRTWLQVNWRALGTGVSLTAKCKEREATQLQDRIFDEFHACERTMSRFLEDSELTLLNRSLDQPRQVSSRLFGVLQEAEKAFLQTKGLFDPRVITTLQELGYRGASVDRPTANPESQSAWITFLGENTVTLHHPIDLGGIGKGYTLDRCASILWEYSEDFLLNAGGDIIHHGLTSLGEHWNIGVESPFDTRALLAVWQLRGPTGGALCTSADSKRRWAGGDGRMHHHLIDPFSSQSGGNLFRSVTALGLHASQTEIATKVLYLRDIQEAKDFLGHEPEVLCVSNDGELLVTDSARPAIIWTTRPLGSLKKGGLCCG